MKIKFQNGLPDPSKEEILKNIKFGLKTVKEHVAGKIKPKEAREFLNELK